MCHILLILFHALYFSIPFFFLFLVCRALASGTHPFAAKLKAAQNPIIIIGDNTFQRDDADSVFALAQKVAASSGSKLNVLHQAAGTVAALDIGYKGWVSLFANIKQML